jgi:putative FmdB family regulatory protein
VPRYEYACQQCEQHYDIDRPMSEASDPHQCPFCGADAKRVFTAPKFLFKPDPNDVRPVWHNHQSVHEPGHWRTGLNSDEEIATMLANDLGQSLGIHRGCATSILST